MRDIVTATSQLFASQIHAMLERERSRIAGLCASLVSNAAVAEDVAQETPYEAWKHRHNMRAHDRSAEWLTDSARNVCRRWKQREHRDAMYRARVPLLPDGAADASHL